ncbi:ABC transporter permease [uncultured Kiloniella sp.]|uniref:ABC transporter permease n=1 Tax=uncultured Kiloniella sp. TaxID=1133091 RepID=UPI002620993A|nr:ABC transporter permease [uncultured Kiloniella sp.]
MNNFMRVAAIKIVSLLLVLFCVSFLTFLLYYYAPGDKALAIANARYIGEGSASAELVEQIRLETGIDRPLFVQFYYWAQDIIQLDFGVSLISQEPVDEIFVSQLWETMELALSALLLGMSVAIPLSLISVWKPKSFIDRFAIALSSIGAAIPSYWLGLIFIFVFAANLQWLPAYGTGSLSHLILPASTLGLWVLSSQTRLIRSFLLEASTAPFLEALKIRGVGSKELFCRHIVRHAFVPFVTMLGLELAFLLEGAVIVEVVFARGGIGSLLVHSVMGRDFPIIQCIVLFSAVTYVTINSAVEIFQWFMNPVSQQR